jgi:hypothetical protein
MPKLKPLPSYGDLIPIKEFIKACKDGSFIDYDGSGCYATDSKMLDVDTCPSEILENIKIAELKKEELPLYIGNLNNESSKKLLEQRLKGLKIKPDYKKFTHIMWFNK